MLLYCCLNQPSWRSLQRFLLFVQMSTFLLFVLPVLLITWFYVLIGLELRQSRAASDSLGLAANCNVIRVTSSNRRTASSMSAELDNGSATVGDRRVTTATPRKSIVKMLGKVRCILVLFT